VEFWKGWKRIVSCNRREKLIDTNSIKNETIILKASENDSGPLSQNTENQQIIKNDIVQNEMSSNEIESVDCGHPDTGTQLIAHSGEECKGTMKENMMGDKLKVYTFSVDDKNVGTGQEGSKIILTGISAAVTEGRKTVNDDEIDGTEKLNTNGTDVSNDVYSNVGKKMEIVENRTVDGTQETMTTATKKTGLIGLFRSPVLRKYNLIMIFVW
jgi:hypothetical protein